MVSWLKETVGFLADDRLEGRRTGTPGEELAYRYISQQFNKIGLEPLGDQNGYIQPFDVYDGRAIDSKLPFYKMTLRRHYTPAFSPWPTPAT